MLPLAPVPTIPEISPLVLEMSNPGGRLEAVNVRTVLSMSLAVGVMATSSPTAVSRLEIGSSVGPSLTGDSETVRVAGAQRAVGSQTW